MPEIYHREICMNLLGILFLNFLFNIYPGSSLRSVSSSSIGKRTVSGSDRLDFTFLYSRKEENFDREITWDLYCLRLLFLNSDPPRGDIKEGRTTGTQ